MIWVSIACLKVVAIIVDYSLEASMDEALLASPLSMCVIVILGLVTFGADDFLDFLRAFFIELGIMMFERTYLGEIVGFCIEYAEERLPQAFAAVQQWFSSEDDAVEEGDLGPAGPTTQPGEQAEAEAKPKGDGDGSNDSSNSEVFFSEEDSGGGAGDDELQHEDPDALLNNPNGGGSDVSKQSGSGQMSGHLQRMEDADVDKADLERRRRERNQEEQSSGVGEGDSEKERSG